MGLADGVRAGTEWGQSLQTTSGLSSFVKGLTERATALGLVRAEAQIQTDEKIRSAGPIAEAEAAAKAKYPDPWIKMMQDKMASGDDDYYVDSVNASGPTFKSLSGLSSEGGGRFGLTSSGVRQIGQAKQILFPDGTPKSFRRDLAGRMQGSAWGATIGSRDAQDLEFLLGRAIAAQTRAETGAAMPESEVKKAVRDFIANAAADPDSAYLRMDELEKTLISSQTAMDPSGRMAKAVGQQVGARSTPAPVSRPSLEEPLDERGLPPGSEIIN